MSVRHTGRLWGIGGAVVAAALLAIGWFFFINPQNALTNSLNDEEAVAQVRLTTLRHRLVELQKQNDNLAHYRAELERNRSALPMTADMADFLRGMQAAGDDRGVAVGGVSVGEPSKVKEAAKPVYSMPITVTATGRAGKLYEFLHQVQLVQPRAVLVTGVSAVEEAQGPGSPAGLTTLTLSMKAFVAPPSDAAKAQAAAAAK